MEKVNKKLKNLKSKLKFSKVKQKLKDPEVIFYLTILQKYVMCPIDEAANNIIFICKSFYVQVFLKELDLLTTTSNTYQQVNDTLYNIRHQNNTLDDSNIGLKNDDKEFNCLPCI